MVAEKVEKLSIIEKIERGRQQSRNGDTISEAELDADIETWFE